MEGAEIDLIAGKGGTFIVIADGEKLWDKLKMGNEFPDEDVIVAKISGRSA